MHLFIAFSIAPCQNAYDYCSNINKNTQSPVAECGLPRKQPPRAFGLPMHITTLAPSVRRSYKWVR